MDEPEVYPKAWKTIGNGKILPLNFNECWRSFTKGCTIKMFHEDFHWYWLAHGMVGQKIVQKSLALYSVNKNFSSGGVWLINISRSIVVKYEIVPQAPVYKLI